MNAQPEQAWLEELYELLRIPSVSADPAHEDDVRRAGEWVCDFVRAAGGEAELVETNTFPLAVGEIPASNGNGDAPTVILYGHFDVQPPAPLDLWESDPFEPEIRDGYLYARGSVDDKGNSYLLLKAAEQLAREGALPVNVRIAFDGEEETGGHSIVEFLEADERGADACIIFDSGMPREDVPSFDLGTRGLIYFHVRLRSGERDLHSGMFGGAALNGVHALMQTLEAVVAVPDELRAGVASADRGGTALVGASSTRARTCLRPKARGRWTRRAAEDFYLRTLAGPAVDVNGIDGGEPILQKTVLPVAAEANVSIRLAPGQDVDEIAAALRAPPARRCARRRRPRDRALVLGAGRAHPCRCAGREARAGRLRARARTPPSAPAHRGHAADRPRARRPGHPDDPHRLRLPGANIHSPNERLLARYIPLGVAAARETLLAFKAL